MLEAETLTIREEERLGEQERGTGHDGRVVRAIHLILDELHDFGVLEQAFAHGLEDVVHHDGGGLTLGYGFAGGVHLVLGEVVNVFAVRGGDVGRCLVAPLLEVDVLVLECVG